MPDAQRFFIPKGAMRQSCNVSCVDAKALWQQVGLEVRQFPSEKPKGADVGCGVPQIYVCP
eukprot:scaffold329256_cov91-Tisochrysis_lutea.AAC.1